ncbi:hypothetical protein COHA_005904 [Chlorella ohadii]|uniref:Uncharacterized protein n=1 Tax=Chlorella ohadii TaxID=2649997 RepID=A0AAD5DU04_9CHLO|nr:hypothetical protein COHA_005904 [Chlorella ohadii]
MASRGEVLPADGGFKAVFQHAEQQHTVAPLPSAEAAALVLDVLEVHQCLAVGLPLDPARLHSDARLPQLARMAGAAGLQVCPEAVPGGQWQGMSLPDLVQQLNSCAAEAPARMGTSDLPGLLLLHSAAGLGLLPLVQLLLTLMGDPAAALTPDLRRCTAVHAAAAAGHTAVVQWLMANVPGISSLMTTHSHTPLHAAAAGGHTALINILLAAMPGIAATPDDCGRPPLLLAAAGGHTPAMAVLLEAVPEAIGTAATDGITPLLAAVKGGHLEAARMLLAAAPETAEAVAYGRYTALHLASNSAPLMELLLQHIPRVASTANFSEQTPLRLATAANNTAVMQLLLAAAPDTLHARTHDGRSEAHAAAEAGSVDALQLLVHLAPELATAADRWGRTPLHLASYCGHLAIVDALLVHTAGAAHAVANGGWLPLHDACYKGQGLVVSRLLEAAPATFSAVDTRGRNVLHFAAASGHADLVAQLLALSLPAAAQAVDNHHSTPLLLAARGSWLGMSGDPAGHTAAVQQLLAAAPASARVPDNLGNLPLHEAASSDNAGAVRLLLAAAPDTAMAHNAEGRIPLELIGPRRNTEAAKLLPAACPAAAGLSFLAARPRLAAACAGAFVRAHLPLTEEQWQQLRQSYHEAYTHRNLAQLLPVALEHSPDQACLLVRQLTDPEQARLRTFGLCLARLQRRLRIPLPGPLAGTLMALFGA